jgi:hypothetical protein
MQVYDFWWPWNTGIVTKVLKTRVKVRFGYDHNYYFINHPIDKDVTYDIPHLKFLVPGKGARGA